VSETSFGGDQVADRAWETVPGGWTSNGKSPAAVHVLSRWRGCAVDFAQWNRIVSGWTFGHDEWRGPKAPDHSDVVCTMASRSYYW